ncbi:uncharacterized protein LOC114712607 [Neltuma alba]|uniref:uncharacterized protein LOC114712607 n=1 Tax=Neltuma alba TaxID=207710 RepID=UPI0010A4A9C8|nr:uncharacterized protein LOC114712607 [Prosopis alba]
MAAKKCSLLKEVNDSTDRWRITVRVIRRWNVYKKESPTKVFCVSMLLIDEEGTRIQASIMNKNLFDCFSAMAVEGITYFMANFVVSPNNKEYRATNHAFKLTLGTYTYVKEVLAQIPEYSYHFFPIRDIIKMKESNHVDYLIDVIGFVASIGHLEEYKSNNEIKNKLRLLLCNTVGCVLYDDCATNVCMMDISTMQSPVVMIMQLGRIGFDDDGMAEICSSYHATQISCNPKFPEVKHFIDSATTLPSPTISTISHTATTQSNDQSATSLLRNHPLIFVADICNQPADSFFLIKCLVVKVDTSMAGAMKVAPGVAANQGVLRVHYTVEDSSGKATVVFFDKLASNFFQKTALEMNHTLIKEEREYDFPDELDLMVGKTVLLKLKLNKYNVDFPNSGISVASFTQCTDLMDEFNEVSDQNTHAEEEATDTVVPESVTADPLVLNEVTNVAIDENDEDSPGIEEIPLSRIAGPSTYRPKRKVAGKRIIGVKEKWVRSPNASPIKTSSKPLKSIKQEKN